VDYAKESDSFIRRRRRIFLKNFNNYGISAERDWQYGVVQHGMRLRVTLLLVNFA